MSTPTAVQPVEVRLIDAVNCQRKVWEESDGLDWSARGGWVVEAFEGENIPEYILFETPDLSHEFVLTNVQRMPYGYDIYYYCEH